MSEPHWATLFEAAHRMEAEIIKEALEAQGFPSEIFQEGVLHYTALGGRIDVCVPSDRLEEAQVWLAGYQEGQLQEVSEEELKNMGIEPVDDADEEE
jgi:hypothetical protein